VRLRAIQVRESQRAKDEGFREAKEEEEQEEIRKIMEDEQIQLLDASERANLSYLDALTGRPREDDVLHYAMVVCAPLSALQGYKYVQPTFPVPPHVAGSLASSVRLHKSLARNSPVLLTFG
jgi:hypothetical protein